MGIIKRWSYDHHCLLEVGSNVFYVKKPPIKLQKVLRTRAHIGIDPQKLTKIDCIDTMPTTCAIIPSMPCVCYLCALHGGLGKAEGWVMLYGDCSGC